MRQRIGALARPGAVAITVSGVLLAAATVWVTLSTPAGAGGQPDAKFAPIMVPLLAMAAVGLMLSLRQPANPVGLEELRASRQRLVAAQDGERRRLERNLHDGAQQNLVAIKVKLGLAEMLSSKDPEKARGLISDLKADTDEALETLRDRLEASIRRCWPTGGSWRPWNHRPVRPQCR